MNRVTTTETQDETPFQTTDATRYEHRPDPTRPDPTRFFSSYVCMHLPTPVVESANYVMHASSLTYTGETPTLHAESSTIEHLDEDWQPRCTTRAVNMRTGVKRTCTAPAKWFHVCGVCSLDGYSCDRCRRHAIERARCYGCMRWIADYWTWRPL